MRVKPRSPFGRAVRRLVLIELRRVKKLAASAIGGEVEPIHDLRASLRRIRVLLDTDGGDRSKRLRRRAGQFSKALGKVRDMDVCLELISESPEHEALHKALESSRQLELMNLREEMKSSRYRRWTKRMVAWSRKDGTAEVVEVKLPEALRGASANALSQFAGDSEEDLHLLRIGVKNCRYLIELFADALPAGAIGLAADLRAAQDAFGAERDRQRLSEYAASRGVAFPLEPIDVPLLQATAREALTALESFVG